MGLRTLAAQVDLLIIVDVLSFSTAVEVATARGACIYPYPTAGGSAHKFAAAHGALLAVSRREMSAERPYSLSPRSLTAIPSGSRLVLPSPNGSTLTTLASNAHLILAGCLRNARAVARCARLRTTIGVIAAGELRPDGSRRCAVEDLVGAGAILSHFAPELRSPEAEAAVAAFERVADRLPEYVALSTSGRELTELGFADDVALAAELDVSDNVPAFGRAGAYVSQARSSSRNVSGQA